MIKKTFLLAVMLIASITAWAEVIGGGKCGENVSYSLTDDGVLTIYGVGPTEDHVNYKYTPWYIDCNYDLGFIRKVVVEEGITAIGNYFLGGLYNEDLVVSLPSTLERIGQYAFASSNMKEITLPEGLKSLDDFAFTFCSNLTSITLPNSLKTMDEGTFTYCSNLQVITIGDGLEEISKRAFNGCEALSTINGGKYTRIDESAFSYCSSLVNLELPETLQSIGTNAFISSGLTSLTLPNSVTTIDIGAFYAANKLETLHIGSGVTKYHYPLLMGSCYALKSITVDEANPVLCSVDGVVYSKDMKYLIAYPSNRPGEEYYVPEGVEYVGIDTEGNVDPSKHLFSHILNLKKLVFANSVKEYGPAIVDGASSIEEITLGSGTEKLHASAFETTTVSTSKMKKLKCKAISVPAAETNTFYKSTITALYVPKCSMDAYNADNNWNRLHINALDFSIAVPEADEKGSFVTTSKTVSYGDEDIVITATLANELCTIESITVTDENGNDIALTPGSIEGKWTFHMPYADVKIEVTYKYEEIVVDPDDPITKPNTYAKWEMTSSTTIEEGDYLIACDLALFQNEPVEPYVFCVPGNNVMDWWSGHEYHDGTIIASNNNTFHITPVKSGYYIQLPNGNYLYPNQKNHNGAGQTKTPTIINITKSGKYYLITCDGHELKTYSKTYGFTPAYKDNLEQQQGLWTLFKRSGTEEYVADEPGFIVDLDKKGGEAKMISCLAAGEWVMPATTEVEGETYTYTSIAAYALSGAEITSATLPASLLSIEAGAFMDCKSLESVIIGESKGGDMKKAPRMEKGMEGNLTIDSKAFAGCTTLSTFCCMLTTPPVVHADAFEGVNVEKCQLIVPEESIELYKADAIWGKFLINEADVISTIAIKEAQSASGFDLTGRPAQFNKAGIYIVNGKKTIVK